MGEQVVAECLAEACEAWLRARTAWPDEQVEDVVRLSEYRVFSNRHLEAITGLSEMQVALLTKKTDRTGGRLNVETLPLMMRLAQDWERGTRNGRLVQMVVGRGTSRGMLAKLTGIPISQVDRLMASPW